MTPFVDSLLSKANTYIQKYNLLKTYPVRYEMILPLIEQKTTTPIRYPAPDIFLSAVFLTCVNSGSSKIAPPFRRQKASV